MDRKSDPLRKFLCLLPGIAFGCGLTVVGGPEHSGYVAMIAATMLWGGWILAQWLSSETIKWPFGVEAWILAALFFWPFLSSLWADDARGAVENGWTTGMLSLGFLLWSLTPKAETCWSLLFRLLARFGALLAALSTYQFLSGAPRGTGFFIDGNLHAAMMNAFYFACVWHWLAMRRVNSAVSAGRVWFWLAQLFLLGMLSTLSLGGLLCFAVVWALTLIAARGTRLLARRDLAGIAIAFVVLYALVSIYGSTVRLPLNKLVNFDEGSFSHRLYLWQSALELIGEHPLLGTGFGSFSDRYPAVRLLAETSTTGDYVHNDYLQFLVEGGLVWGTCLAGVALFVGFRLLRLRKHCAAAPVATAQQQAALLGVIGLLGGAAALFLQAGINFVFFSPAPALLAGLFIAQSRHALKENTLYRVTIPGSTKLVKPLYWSVATVFVAWLGFSNFLDAIVHDRCWSPVCEDIRTSHESSYRFSLLATTIMPHSIAARIWFSEQNAGRAYATTNSELALRSARLAQDQYFWLLQHNPEFPQAYFGMAQLLKKFPTLAARVPPALAKDPETLLRASIAKDPYWISPYLVLVRLLADEGRKDEALRLICDEAVPRFPTSIVNKSEALDLIATGLYFAEELGAEPEAKALQTAKADIEKFIEAYRRQKRPFLQLR